MPTYLRLTITETLDLPSGVVSAGDPLARMVRTVWCRLPADWVADGGLRACQRRWLIERLGEPGLAVVLDARATVLSPVQAGRRPWLGEPAACFVCAGDGTLRGVHPGEL